MQWPSHLMFFTFYSYMRHAYGLGEHYNAVEPLKDAAAEEQNWNCFSSAEVEDRWLPEEPSDDG